MEKTEKWSFHYTCRSQTLIASSSNIAFMRVAKCPDCGKIIVDNPLWRPSGFKWGVDFMSIDDFKNECPILAERLIADGQWTEDELYIYRLSKFGTVYRMAKLEYTKETFLLHGLTDSATHRNPYPKNYHYEKLKKAKQQTLHT